MFECLNVDSKIGIALDKLSNNPTFKQSNLSINLFSLQRKNKLIEEDKSRRCKLFKHETFVVGHQTISRFVTAN